MNRLKYIFSLMALLLLANGCQKFDDLEADPNRSKAVPPGLVLRGLLKDMYNAPWSDEQRWNQYWCSNYNYYDNNEYWGGSTDLRFTSLKNVDKMEEEALRVNLQTNNTFAALGKFFRAYFYYDMTMKVGDLPLREALKGAETTQPAYDTQEAIFQQILSWLDESNTALATQINGGQTLDEKFYFNDFDFYLNGDLVKWQKAVNAFRIRVLVQLSKKAGNTPSLNVSQKFADMINNPAQYPLPESNEDNLQYLFGTTEKYPFNQDNFGFYALRYNTSATYVTTLANLHDPRVFVVAEPAAAKIAGGLTPQDYEAYVGAPSDEGLDDMSTKVQAGDYSLINKTRYFSTYTGEPSIQIGYSELCFNVAEGINRGWAAGDAQDWYNKGIAASMAFYGITDATVLATYLAQTDVAYKGNNSDGLSQILTQKYLALSQHSGLEGYFNWRRTGIPTFYQGGPGTGNSGVIPMRFKYPTSERDNNSVNYTAALLRQGNPDDNINTKLWVVE